MLIKFILKVFDLFYIMKNFKDYIDSTLNVFLESFETKIDIHYKTINGVIHGNFSLNNID
jgi:hypothetical protein